MPMIGNKKFAYSKKGKEMAKDYAKKTGMKMADKKMSDKKKMMKGMKKK
jgi:hypothetical protein